MGLGFGFGSVSVKRMCVPLLGGRDETEGGAGGRRTRAMISRTTTVFMDG